MLHVLFFLVLALCVPSWRALCFVSILAILAWQAYLRKTSPKARALSVCSQSYLTKEQGGVEAIELMFSKPELVLDVSRLAHEEKARSDPTLSVFDVNDVFGPGEHFFLAFGKPNMYTAFTDATVWRSFHAKSFWRAPSAVHSGQTRLQSGILLVFKNLPPDALSRFGAAFNQHAGKRHVTCVNANCALLDSIGFTFAGGKSLVRHHYVLPMTLLETVLAHGLELRGMPVEFDIVKTTAHDFEMFRHLVLHSVCASFVRHSWLARFAPLLFPNPTPTGTHHQAPNSNQQAQEKRHRIRVFYPSGVLGSLMAILVGRHLLVRIDAQITQAAFPALAAFPHKRPPFHTRIKKAFLFSPPVVAFIRWWLFSGETVFAPLFSSDQIFAMLMPDATYNLVIDSKGQSLMKLTAETKLAQLLGKVMDWVLTKHVLMSNYGDDVLFAGEVYRTRDNKIQVTGNSGTYMPNNETTDWARKHLASTFQGVAFE